MAEENKKHKILVVEDDAFMMELLAQKLGEAGFEVVSAANGEEAAAQFTRFSPELILLDILLPGEDGLEILRKIRRMPGGAEVKVLILSNLSEQSRMDEANLLGVAGYLVKATHNLSEIVEKVKSILSS